MTNQTFQEAVKRILIYLYFRKTSDKNIISVKTHFINEDCNSINFGFTIKLH